MRKKNKVVRISYSGGFIGLLIGSSRGKLEAILQEHNKDGWILAEVVPDNPNLIIWIVRLLLLVLTLGLWTLSNGYLLILEKPVEHFGTASDGHTHKEPGRKEPRLFAQR